MRILRDEEETRPSSSDLLRPLGDLRNPSDWGKEPTRLSFPCAYAAGMGEGCHNNVHAAERSGRFQDLEAATAYIIACGRRRQAIRKGLGI